MTLRILSSLAILFSAVGFAGTASADNARTIAKLENAIVQTQPLGTKLGAVQLTENAKRRSEIEAAIAELRAGQSVDPKEIDRLLKQASPWRE